VASLSVAVEGGSLCVLMEWVDSSHSGLKGGIHMLKELQATERNNGLQAGLYLHPIYGFK